MEHDSIDGWVPTRAEGLRRLDDFVPRAGRDYAETRNYDHGPGDRSNVSTLSPYIRHRLVREDEVAAAVLGRYRYETAEKFLQELCWRTYWKGWLELRPKVWSDYRARVESALRSLDGDPDLRDRWERATSGRSGIGCLDAWSRELVETGYLHNHARMWFASLWIFTLELPWALGADFFFRHLLDGDPASNTLSWRWVAGLQTAGKTYLASPSNVARFTSGRFRPSERFADAARPVEGPPPPRPGSLPRAERVGEGPVGLLLTDDDLDPTGLGLEPGRVVAVAGLLGTPLRSPLPTGRAALAFAEGALEDALGRASSAFEAPSERFGHEKLFESVLDWAERSGVRRVVSPYAPQGPTRDLVDAIRARLSDAGVALVAPRRAWDDVFWPSATAGFFPFKAKIPDALGRLGVPN